MLEFQWNLCSENVTFGGSDQYIPKNGIVFSVRIYCDNNSVCNGCQRRLNIKYWYRSERRLKDDLRCRTLEIPSYCHPTATFDIMQPLFSVSSRIKDWSAAHWKACHINNLLKVRCNIYWPTLNKVTWTIPILSLILVAGPKAQGLATMILKCRWNYFYYS